MAIARFDPFRDLAVLHDRVNRLFGDAHDAREEGVLSNWVPAVDIFENEKKELVLKAELPDLAREDVAVTVENNTLTIRGERKLDASLVGRVELALDAARAAVKGDEKDAITRASDELQSASHAMAEALYKAQADAASAGPGQTGGVKDADVVDAEFAETK